MTRAPPTILVVEDNPLTRKMLRVALVSDGYGVLEAGDGRSALQAVETFSPELVLQDLILPDMNGFELVQRLRELPQVTDVPILALSGFVGRIEEAQTARAGFDALLLKPIEPARLLEVVGSYFPRQNVQTIGAGQRRRLLLADEDAVQLKLMRVHFEHLGFEVDAASSARDVLLAARRHAPDVILSSVFLPDADGFELCVDLRRDPELGSIPVVLLTSWTDTDVHRELADQVGANSLVLRTPALDLAARAIEDAVARGAPKARDEPSDQVKLKHMQLVIKQLQRELAMGAGLARRCTLQAAQLSLLSGVADALTHRTDTEVAFRDVLAAMLDGAGISKGALFLQEAGGLQLRHALGFQEAELHGLRDFFGQRSCLEDVVAKGSIVVLDAASTPPPFEAGILSEAGVVSMQIVPLISEQRGVGAIVLGATSTDVASEESLTFARAMGNQLVQWLEVARSIERIRVSEKRYRTLMESARDGVALLTPEGRIREVNRRLPEMLGRSVSELLNRHIADFARKGAERASIEAHEKTFVAGGGRTPAVELEKSDGSSVFIEFSNTVVELGGEQLVFSVGRDVSEQLRAQAQLMVADRMVSIGTLAAGVAHEINNPLAAIIANLDLAANEVLVLSKSLGIESRVQDLGDEIQDARDAAERVRNIVRDLKLFSRAGDERAGPVDVHRVLDSSLRMAWNEIRHRATLVKDYGDVLPVMGNESRLGQVFLNLVVNAAQAIAEGHANDHEIRVRTRMDDQQTRVFTDVMDTGPGIPTEHRSRLFTPFFTTKPVGIGTGLGLAICHRIVTGLGGEISVTSEMGKGTMFRVALPAVEATLRPSERPPRAPSTTRRGRILVLDDEWIVGKAVERALGKEHDVTTYTRGDEALRAIEDGQHFELILCDLMMPVMTGMDFHAALAKSDPEQASRVVFLTGGAFSARARSFLDEVSNARLDKPFDIEALRSLVYRRLAADG